MFYVVVSLVILAVLFGLNRLRRTLKVSGLQDKHVLITGCDSGFGRQFAKRLDGMGVPVLAGCLKEDTAQSLSQECSSRLTTIILDVSKVDSIARAVDIVKQRLPNDKALWAVVNNAGIMGHFSHPEWCDKEDFMEVFDVNIYGVTEMTRQFLPLIRKSKGRIVNTASVAGKIAFVGAPYTCSKFAVIGYTHCMRRHTAQLGVKMSTVEPGAFQTPIFAQEKSVGAIRKAYERLTPEVQKTYDTSVLEKYCNFVKMFGDTASPNTELVVNDYLHAVTARYPKTRYCPGWDATLLYRPLSVLPDWISDFVLEAVGAIPKNS